MKNERSISIVQTPDGRVGLKFNSPMVLSEALQLYFTGALALLQSYTPKLPDLPVPQVHSEAELKAHDEAKGEIFDLFNAGASHVLDAYAPEIAMRPDLTTEAVFEAELNLLSSKYGIPEDAVKEYAQKTRRVLKQNAAADKPS